MGLPRQNLEGNRKLALIGKLVDAIAITERYQWTSGCQIFYVDSKALKELLQEKKESSHLSLKNGTNILCGDLHYIPSRRRHGSFSNMPSSIAFCGKYGIE